MRLILSFISCFEYVEPSKIDATNIFRLFFNDFSDFLRDFNLFKKSQIIEEYSNN